jgi:hypothetical protein
MRRLAGSVTTLAGGVASGYQDGSGTNVKFSSALNLIVISTTNIMYATDNDLIRTITTNGR